jgi:aspartyl-tRNA(Asn)/glutamyl-tRNA(Gln) amidotransferase subunit A
MAADLADIVRDEMRERPGDFGPWIRPLIRMGQLLPAADYIRAQRLRERYRADVARAMAAVDIIVTPTVPYAPWPLGASEVELDDELVPYVPSVGTYTPPWNVTGMPAISIPCGFTANGLPLGLQLAGRPLEDGVVLRLAHAYQQATDWHLRRPPVCA